MIRPGERTCPLQRPGLRPVRPERLLRCATGLQSANRKDVGNVGDHDVAFEHAATATGTSAVDAPRRFVVAHAAADLARLSGRSYEVAPCRGPTRDRSPHTCGVDVRPACRRAACSSIDTAGIERRRGVRRPRPWHGEREQIGGFLTGPESSGIPRPRCVQKSTRISPVDVACDIWVRVRAKTDAIRTRRSEPHTVPPRV